MSAAISTELECRIMEPDAFAADGYPRAESRRMRAEAPVRRVAQLDHLEPAGPVARRRSNFIGCIEHLPVHYCLN
jgi:hypothetical protein